MIDLALFVVGSILLLMSSILSLIGAVGFLRFRNFFLRLHPATVGSIGGGVYALIGIALLTASLDIPDYVKYYVVGVSIISAALIVFASPTGSHILARAAYRSRETRPEPIIRDKLKEAGVA
ncbi:monovalent cation/H(+) antiporter subunit G [Thermogladius sp. 4427co]|uniref:monovalent cation/H(+) antiporter subunit G n=1 Tax=Thermogladius sp. 4427co TaxID=3450718 RepID=UPI003F7A56C8